MSSPSLEVAKLELGDITEGIHLSVDAIGLQGPSNLEIFEAFT